LKLALIIWLSLVLAVVLMVKLVGAVTLPFLGRLLLSAAVMVVAGRAIMGALVVVVVLPVTLAGLQWYSRGGLAVTVLELVVPLVRVVAVAAVQVWPAQTPQAPLVGLAALVWLTALRVRLSLALVVAVAVVLPPAVLVVLVEEQTEHQTLS
jgi:hypothetical protein